MSQPVRLLGATKAWTLWGWEMAGYEYVPTELYGWLTEGITDRRSGAAVNEAHWSGCVEYTGAAMAVV
jgi:hypothetical protein